MPPRPASEHAPAPVGRHAHWPTIAPPAEWPPSSFSRVVSWATRVVASSCAAVARASPRSSHIAKHRNTSRPAWRAWSAASDSWTWVLAWLARRRARFVAARATADSDTAGRSSGPADSSCPSIGRLRANGLRTRGAAEAAPHAGPARWRRRERARQTEPAGAMVASGCPLAKGGLNGGQGPLVATH